MRTEPVYQKTQFLLHKQGNLSMEARAYQIDEQKHVTDNMIEDWWTKLLRQIAGCIRG